MKNTWTWRLVGVAALAALLAVSGWLIFLKPKPPSPVPLPLKSKVNARDGAVMVWVPAGEFTMGSTDAQVEAVVRVVAQEALVHHKRFRRDRLTVESPAHKVSLDGIWMYRNDVTVAQYRVFCQATKRAMPPTPSWGWLRDHPVVNVTWLDAVAYAKWAGCRLPTEAEWEKAARGTDGRIYPWGNNWDASRLQYSSKQMGDAKGTAPVGSFPLGASPYGCLDMAGNVWQWCGDWFASDYYGKAPVHNPQGPPSGTEHVLRGGSWFDFSPILARAAYREQGGSPSFRSDFAGFRCAAAK